MRASSSGNCHAQACVPVSERTWKHWIRSRNVAQGHVDSRENTESLIMASFIYGTKTLSALDNGRTVWFLINMLEYWFTSTNMNPNLWPFMRSIREYELSEDISVIDGSIGCDLGGWGYDMPSARESTVVHKISGLGNSVLQTLSQSAHRLFHNELKLN